MSTVWTDKSAIESGWNPGDEKVGDSITYDEGIPWFQATAVTYGENDVTYDGYFKKTVANYQNTSRIETGWATA